MMLADHYPTELQTLIKNTAQDMHVPPDVIALNILPAISGAINNHTYIDAPWGKISPSVFTLTLIGSGGRKSALQSFLFKPHREHQKQALSLYTQKMKAFTRDTDQNKWSKSEKDDNMPKDPRIILTSGATIQKMIQEMALREPVGFVSIMDEIMSFFAGYSGKEKRIQTGSLITGLWGGNAETGSMTNGVLSAYDKHVAISWFGQPAPIHEYLADPYLRMQGVLSRFLMIERYYPLMHNPNITIYKSDVYKKYQKRLSFLLSQIKIKTLTVSTMGKLCIDEAIDDLFSSHYEDGSIESQFISRYQEHVLRVAACLHCYGHDANEISTDTVMHACKLVDKLFSEWKKVILPSSVNIFDQSIEKVGKWLSTRNDFTEDQLRKSKLKLNGGVTVDLSNKDNNRQKILDEFIKMGKITAKKDKFKVNEIKPPKESQWNAAVNAVDYHAHDENGLQYNYDEVDRRPGDPTMSDEDFFNETGSVMLTSENDSDKLKIEGVN